MPSHTFLQSPAGNRQTYLMSILGIFQTIEFMLDEYWKGKGMMPRMVDRHQYLKHMIEDIFIPDTPRNLGGNFKRCELMFKELQITLEASKRINGEILGLLTDTISQDIPDLAMGPTKGVYVELCNEWDLFITVYHSLPED